MMDYFYIQDSKLPVATLKQAGITQLSETVPSSSMTEAATISSVSRAYYPAVPASNLSTATSNMLYSRVQPTAASASNTAVYSSNLCVTNSNSLFPAVADALHAAQAAQTTADAGLGAGLAAGTAAAAAAAGVTSLATEVQANAVATNAALATHQAEITAAQTAADAASSAATTAQQAADKAQQTGEQALAKTQHWVFSSNTIQNLHQPTLALTFSNDQYITTNRSIRCSNKIIADAALAAPAWISPSNGECRYDSTALKLKHASAGNIGYLYLAADSLEYQTVGGAAVQQQFSVTSNGTCYIASNIQMPSTAVLRATQAPTLDTPYREGVIRLTPDALRYVTLSNDGLNNTYQKQCFSVNSNGVFALLRCALLGREESVTEPDPINALSTVTPVKFPRLEMTLADGLRFGSGIQAQVGGPDLDYCKIDKAGTISCLNQTNGLLEAITLNACPAKGGLAMENSGLTVAGRPVISSAGEIVRRVDLNAVDGFKISPSGYLTMGGLQITPQGLVISACNAGFGSITQNGTPLSSVYAPSNALQNYASLSNFTATSNDLYRSNMPLSMWCSNNFSNVSQVAAYGSNLWPALCNTSNLSYALSNYHYLTTLPKVIATSNTAYSALSAAQGAQSTADAAMGSAAAAATSAAANAAAIVS